MNHPVMDDVTNVLNITHKKGNTIQYSIIIMDCVRGCTGNKNTLATNNFYAHRSCGSCVMCHVVSYDRCHILVFTYGDLDTTLFDYLL